MSQEQKCSQCLEEFTFMNPPRTMPTCEHNICTKCLKEAIQHRHEFIDCQFCYKKIKKKQIKLFPKNYRQLQRMRIDNTTNPTPKGDKSAFHPNAPPKPHLIPKQQDELLINIECPSPLKSLTSSMCEIHKMSLDIICATDRKRICPHCAIFGDHKDHRFRTSLEFEGEIQEKIAQFNSIKDKKQLSEKTEFTENIKLDASAKLNARKQYLHMQIQKTLERLIQSIRKAQHDIQEQLQEKFISVKAIINQNLSNEVRLKKNYLNWERLCQDTVNRLNMTKNLNNRVQIYFDSPLQICGQGNMYLEEMNRGLSQLYRQTDEEINAISIRYQQKSFEGHVTLVFPILQESTIGKQLAKIQQSFEKDLPKMKIQPQTREDLNQNSFIFNPQITALHFQQLPQSDRKMSRNRLNKSVTSLNSFNSITNLPILNSVTPGREKNFKSDQKLRERQRERRKTAITSTKGGQKRFGSPDFSKSSRIRQVKTPEQILIQLTANDFINQVDLSQLHLHDKDIFQFIKKAKSIRRLKAIKLQKNHLTDQGLQHICPYLQHIFNLNLSFNNLTDKCLDTLIKNRQFLYKMRIINLSGNKLTSDRTNPKIKLKIQEIKKMGIVVSL